MYDYQLIALLLVLWTQPGDKTITYRLWQIPRSFLTATGFSLPVSRPFTNLHTMIVLRS
jgi:hypothetical protein